MSSSKIKIIEGYLFKAYEHKGLSVSDMIQHSRKFLEIMNNRRSVRDFSDKQIPREVIDNIVRTASTAPSGAHKQPWTFCIISDASTKARIRVEAEKEEYENYHGRMSDEWIRDLEPFQTDWQKPFLETAPYLIVIFKKAYDQDIDGTRRNNYYVLESVGIACGFLLAAIHHAGLVALTHTPSPMNFLSKILKRPDNERPFLLIPVGYPAEDAYIPDLTRKDLEDVAVYY